MVDVFDLIDIMGESEESLTEREFISPIFSGRVVATRVEGIVYTFKIPKTKPGWYKLRPVDESRARIVGEADFVEKEEYLKQLGKCRMVLMMLSKGVYLAIPEKMNKYGLLCQEPVSVLLHDDSVLDFDRIIARYDGVNFWFESVDMRNDPTKAEYLRDSLQDLLDPKKIRFGGLTFEEKLAYNLRFTLDRRLLEDRKKKTLREDVEHAGGKFVKFTERSDHVSVTYRVDGREYTSHVSKDPVHHVITAGICLQGSDHKFDLRSLVTVIREGQVRDLIHQYHDVR